MASSSSLQPVLILYSHGRNPPLHPPPDLKYDLRSIPNPPKALRSVSDGRSKRLREHLLAEEKFVQRLGAVEEEIKNAMEGRLAEWAKSQGEKAKGNDLDGVEIVNKTENGEDDVELKEEDQESDEEDDDGESSDSDSRGEDAVVLRVGCNCALGHHRSVAFVCELASKPWPKDWTVEVVHRDLERKRSGGSREAQKANWKDQRKRDRGIMGTAWE
jgi:hypothetical protein